MEKTLLATRVLAGILFVLLIIALGFLFSAHKQLENSQASAGFAVAHDRIRSDCHGAQGTKSPACMQDLQDLSNTLSEFSKAVGGPAATTTAP